MERFKSYLIAALLIAVALLFVFSGSQWNGSKKDQLKIAAYTDSLTRYKAENKALVADISLHEKDVALQIKTVDSLTRVKQRIIVIHENQIAAVDHQTSIEVDSFFSVRYPMAPVNPDSQQCHPVERLKLAEKDLIAGDEAVQLNVQNGLELQAKDRIIGDGRLIIVDQAKEIVNLNKAVVDTKIIGDTENKVLKKKNRRLKIKTIVVAVGATALVIVSFVLPK